jgi:uncharacterized protein with HEPN domain
MQKLTEGADEVFVNGDSFIPNTRALILLVEVIGEAASHVPEEFRSRYPEVLWCQTVGIHNRLIHSYGRMNRYSGSSGLNVRV